MGKSNISSYLYKFSERILTHATTFVVSIILARLLTPADYGTLSIIMVFVIFSQVLIEGGLSSALIQKKEVEKKDYDTTLTITIVLALCIYVMLAAFAGAIENWLCMEGLASYLRVVALMLFPAAYLSVVKAKLVREMLFKVQMYVTFIGSTLSGLLGIWMAYAGFGIWALIVQQLSTTVFLLLLFILCIKWIPSVTIHIDMEKAKELYNYGWKIMATNLLVRGNNEIVSLGIGKQFSKESLGLYDRGKQFPQAASENIDSTIQSVLFPILSRCQNDIVQLRERTRNMQVIGAYLLFFILAIVAGASPTYIPLLLTEKWMGCIPFLIAWVACYLLNVYTIIATTAINAVGYSSMTLKRQLLTTIPSLIVVLIVVALSKDVFNVMIAKILMIPYMFVVTAYYQKMAIGYGYLDQLHDLLPSLMASFCVFAVLYLLNNVEIHSLSLLVMQGVVSILIYALISVVFKMKGMVYIKELIFKK